MEVHGSDPGDIEYLSGKHVAVVERKEIVRGERPYAVDPSRLTQVIRIEYGYTVHLCKGTRGMEPYLFGRIILMGEEGCYVDPASDQLFQAYVPDLVIRKDDCLHSSSFLTMNLGRLLTS